MTARGKHPCRREHDGELWASRAGSNGPAQWFALNLRNSEEPTTVTIRLYGTLAHFVAPVPAMHSHGAPRRGVLVSLPIAAILTEKGAAGALDRMIKGHFSWSIAGGGVQL